ncbi:hypothetical protein PFLUV_G00009680 [Perca fluviatilis]|uniref:Uncharacterized protein n=1 Tax=Perca fluviatilis TaxID=8168 RepID=A0A6A5FP38_PERFL|nr:hypothetical protein PFLUV_G00009680 [Perca fluviatilis]
MKFILLAACILGVAVCAPTEIFMEFDIHHAPAEAAQAIPAGVPLKSLDVLLPVDAQRQPVGGPVRGFIKQEILEPNGRDTKDVFIPFGFDTAVAPPVAAADPVAPAAPLPLLLLLLLLLLLQLPLLYPSLLLVSLLPNPAEMMMMMTMTKQTKIRVSRIGIGDHCNKTSSLPR